MYVITVFFIKAALSYNKPLKMTFKQTPCGIEDIIWFYHRDFKGQLDTWLNFILWLAVA